MMHDITSIETTCWYKKRLFDEFPTTFVAIEDFKEAIGKKLDKFFKVSRLITPGKRWNSQSPHPRFHYVKDSWIQTTSRKFLWSYHAQPCT